MGDDGGYSIAAELKVNIPGMDKAEAEELVKAAAPGVPLLEGDAQQHRRSTSVVA